MPQHCPTPRELDDLELIGTGALAPLDGFEGEDGLVRLVVPSAVAAAAEAAGALELVDPEGLPLARVSPVSTYPVDGVTTGVHGPVTTLARPEFGPFRSLYLTPAETRERYADRLTVPVAAALTDDDLATVREQAAGAGVVLLALAGHGTPQGLSPVGLIRTARIAADRLTASGAAAAVVVAPLASRGTASAADDQALGEQVVRAYAPAERARRHR